MHKELKIGIIGCGLIGQRRAEIVCRTGNGVLAGLYDLDPSKMSEAAEKTKASTYTNPDELIENCDAIVVATPNKFLSSYGADTLKAGKHLLVEKPGGISAHDIRALRSVANEKHARVGFNLRFHPAALELKNRLIGQSPLWIRAAYGHGGRPGYEKEWRFDKARSGGGEIIDQGVHLLDLLRYFFPEQFYLDHVSRTNMFYHADVEDNGFLTLQGASSAVAQLHCSVNQWKNIFRFEIATQGFLYVWEGLGNKNYGDETLSIFERIPTGGSPKLEKITFEEEKSFELEWDSFFSEVADGKSGAGANLDSALWVMDILEMTRNFEIKHREKV